MLNFHYLKNNYVKIPLVVERGVALRCMWIQPGFCHGPRMDFSGGIIRRPKKRGFKGCSRGYQSGEWRSISAD